MKKRERNKGAQRASNAGDQQVTPPHAKAGAPPPGTLPKLRSKKREWLFRLIGILIPFLLIFILEVFLRIFHYGDDLSLFREYPADSTYLIMNPAASKKYFTHQANATTGNIEPFKRKRMGIHSGSLSWESLLRSGIPIFTTVPFTAGCNIG